MEYADTHTHAHTHEVIQKEIFTNDKNCHRNGDIRREICLWGLYVAYTLQKLWFTAYSRRIPVGLWGLASTPRNSPDFSTLERSRGMGLHLTEFRDALFSFALQTLTCSFLPQSKKAFLISCFLMKPSDLASAIFKEDTGRAQFGYREMHKKLRKKLRKTGSIF